MENLILDNVSIKNNSNYKLLTTLCYFIIVICLFYYGSLRKSGENSILGLTLIFKKSEASTLLGLTLIFSSLGVYLLPTLNDYIKQKTKSVLKIFKENLPTNPSNKILYFDFLELDPSIITLYTNNKKPLDILNKIEKGYIIGSHHAASSYYTNNNTFVGNEILSEIFIVSNVIKNFSVLTDLTLKTQIDLGIRAFDLRISNYNNVYVLDHGFIFTYLKTFLDDFINIVKPILQNDSKEAFVLILGESKYNSTFPTKNFNEIINTNTKKYIDDKINDNTLTSRIFYFNNSMVTYTGSSDPEQIFNHFQSIQNDPTKLIFSASIAPRTFIVFYIIYFIVLISLIMSKLILVYSQKG